MLKVAILCAFSWNVSLFASRNFFPCLDDLMTCVLLMAIIVMAVTGDDIDDDDDDDDDDDGVETL